MLKSIHVAAQVIAKTALLAHSAKKGQLALANYHKVVALLRHTPLHSKALSAKRTKYGEQRLRNCIKYDLGGGYRLVTIRAEARLYLQFLGSHDEADIWLDGNIGFTPCSSASCYPLWYDVVAHEPAVRQAEPSLDIDADVYEEQLRNRLDDRLLQQLFCGICGCSKGNRDTKNTVLSNPYPENR